MIFIKAVIFLSLLHIAYLQADKPDGDDNTGAAGTTSSGCEQTAPATTYWTEWYSSSKPFTIADRQEDFSHLCSSEVLDTECREKYTHRSLESLTTRALCSDGVIRCRLYVPGMPDGWSNGDYNCQSHDLEIRLLCNYTSDKLPEPDLHWSLSELDSGGTRGAVESWNCNDEVMMVDPINGTIVGKVVQGKSLSLTYGPQSHENLCGVQTNGNASLVFRPYVQNCLTSPDCCNSDHGISVMFWLRKNEMDGNHSRPQFSPLHVFRSPSLNATVQSGHFFVTYLQVNTEWTVNTTLADMEWTHVTITFDTLTNLTVYLNGEAEGVAKLSRTSLSFTEEFKADNNSFQVFSTEPGVTSPDIRPIAMTDLKIFFSALSANLIDRMFISEREDATMLNGTEDHVSSTSKPNNGTRSRNESEKTDTGSFVTSESGVIRGRVTDAPDTSSTSSSTPVHDWTSSSEGDTDSVTRKNPSGHHVTNDQDVNDRTPSSISTSAASSPDNSTTRSAPDTSASTTRQAPDTSTSTRIAHTDDSSTPDVASTSRPTDAMSTPGGTKAHVGAKGTSQTTVFNTRRTDYGGSTVSDTVVTSADTSRTTKPTVARPSNGDGGSSKATGNKKITITGNDSAHLNYLYPVMIVALGVGIPTLTACYYLCRKLTPEEIEERRLIEERKRKLEEQEKQTKPL